MDMKSSKSNGLPPFTSHVKVTVAPFSGVVLDTVSCTVTSDTENKDNLMNHLSQYFPSSSFKSYYRH